MRTLLALTSSPPYLLVVPASFFTHGQLLLALMVFVLPPKSVSQCRRQPAASPQNTFRATSMYHPTPARGVQVSLTLSPFGPLASFPS